MGQGQLASPATYDLPLPLREGETPEAARTEAAGALPEALLLDNVLWFCRLRWGVVAILMAFGVLGLLPGVSERLGLSLHPGWPWIVSLALAAGNLAFLGHARRLARSDGRHQAKYNLWGQIALDLIVLTAVVHFVGSLETFIPFTYLFHIVLACIFFSRPESLAVTALACVLYVGCVLAEVSGVVGSAGVYANTALREHIETSRTMSAAGVASPLLIWSVVWYLASRLSVMVRERDYELAESNRRLVQAQRERAQHMLHTTHELKAPFAAIHANAQLLLQGYCGVLPDEALDIVLRIAERCRRLSTEIKEMLQLANLESRSAGPAPPTEIDLAETLRRCIAQVEALAAERKVVVEHELNPSRVVAVQDHVAMLFGNLLANAVIYSHEGGRVRTSCRPTSGGQATVIIEDGGIGIPDRKLPRIFDEYYRTDEAARHNKGSTGLGLAIVRRIADTHRIRVRVESRPGAGTKFTLRFPRRTDADAG